MPPKAEPADTSPPPEVGSGVTGQQDEKLSLPGFSLPPALSDCSQQNTNRSSHSGLPKSKAEMSTVSDAKGTVKEKREFYAVKS